MVYSTITDGIGNILFQISAGSSLAHTNNTDFIACVADTSVYEDKKLVEYINPFRNNILRKITFVEGIPTDSIMYVQPGFEYNPISYIDKIRLTGYFQTEKFFDKEHIRDLFSMDDDTHSYIMSKYKDLFNKELISIHVRRGDYVNRPLRQPVCCMPYFRRAIRYFGKGKHYMIISNDIEWCKKKFKGENFSFIENEQPFIDLYLQTLCTHNIISNSSFSWWGAWLNPNPSKIVIAPKKWFGFQLKNFNLRDLVPEGWVRLRNPKDTILVLRIFKYWLSDILERITWKLTHL